MYNTQPGVVYNTQQLCINVVYNTQLVVYYTQLAVYYTQHLYTSIVYYTQHYCVLYTTLVLCIIHNTSVVYNTQLSCVYKTVIDCSAQNTVFRIWDLYWLQRKKSGDVVRASLLLLLGGLLLLAFVLRLLALRLGCRLGGSLHARLGFQLLFLVLRLRPEGSFCKPGVVAPIWPRPHLTHNLQRKNKVNGWS